MLHSVTVGEGEGGGRGEGGGGGGEGELTGNWHMTRCVHCIVVN